MVEIDHANTFPVSSQAAEVPVLFCQTMAAILSQLLLITMSPYFFMSANGNMSFRASWSKSWPSESEGDEE